MRHLSHSAENQQVGIGAQAMSKYGAQPVGPQPVGAPGTGVTIAGAPLAGIVITGAGVEVIVSIAKVLSPADGGDSAAAGFESRVVGNMLAAEAGAPATGRRAG
jgi:hypothetical protein